MSEEKKTVEKKAEPTTANAYVWENLNDKSQPGGYGMRSHGATEYAAFRKVMKQLHFSPCLVLPPPMVRVNPYPTVIGNLPWHVGALHTRSEFWVIEQSGAARNLQHHEVELAQAAFDKQLAEQDST